MSLTTAGYVALKGFNGANLIDTLAISSMPNNPFLLRLDRSQTQRFRSQTRGFALPDLPPLPAVHRRTQRKNTIHLWAGKLNRENFHFRTVIVKNIGKRRDFTFAWGDDDLKALLRHRPDRCSRLDPQPKLLRPTKIDAPAAFG